MKKLFKLFLILILALVIIKCGDEQSSDDAGNKTGKTDFSKRYGIKSAVIEYELSGSQEGRKTLYFDNWGMRQAEYTNAILSVSGFTKHTNLINIISGDSQFIVDMDKRSGTKTKNPIKEDIKELAEQKSFNEFGEQMLLKSGATKIGEDDFMGKDCDIYENKNLKTKYWIWKWIPLKTETKSGPVNIISQAVKIDENVKIPENKFSLPDNVVISEIDIDNIESRMREENQ